MSCIYSKGYAVLDSSPVVYAWRARREQGLMGRQKRGRLKEDSLLRFPPSHHIPRAMRRGCYRWLETSQMLCFLKVLTFAGSYIAWPCPICFTWPHSWPSQSMSLVTSDNSLRTVGRSTWKRSYDAIDWGLKERTRPFCGNKNKML